jgi:DNA-binding protein WhiA
MSFASETKTELCRSPMNRACCVRSELYGVLLFCNTFSAGELRVLTEHRGFLQRTERLLRRAAGVEADEREGAPGSKLSLTVRDPEKLAKLRALVGSEPARNPALHVNLGVLEEDCCRASFLRGAFLAGGSITSPRKSYHLELITGHYSVSREVSALLREMEFRPGSLGRNGNYVLYFKHSEAIEDLLTLMGAPQAALELMSAKVEKEVVNRVNRRINCDEANLDKTVNAAVAQLGAIRRLREAGKLEALSPKLLEAARLREEHPELNLSQLGALAEPPVTKSTFNYRMKKLMELAEENGRPTEA